jgi:hypothetical protein
MLGGLFGLSHGLEWLPEPLKRVQDQALIADIAAQLLQPSTQTSTEPPAGHWSQRDTQDVLGRFATSNEKELTLGVLDKATIVNRRSLKAMTKHLLVHEWQLRTLGGQTLYIKQLRQTNQQRVPTSKNPPLARHHAYPASQAGSTIPRHIVANLLNDLAQTIPAQFACQTALRMVAKIVALPQPSEATIHALLRDLAPQLSGEEQRALTRVGVKNLGLERERP